MKKVRYLIRTNLVGIFTIILSALMFFLVIFRVDPFGKTKDNDLLTAVSSIAFLTFLYKLLKNIELRGIR
ncbi:hypothetical protein BEP19_03295 [Ammoniphilus oxalaticus]|uniref:Uncharacterized protein n=1 Tax=Ammoniphilus oxalaticus TaxID=66863 RepID=A0A419SNT6_9BACL|nr:hypothetical protein [Ammoniphilus oxalaticus]RKD25964.1 hypothetical protein BEP19_03295 [Ammoniphilus oxalaticus]